MSDRPQHPRVPPLPEPEWDDRTASSSGRAGVPGGDAVNIFATLVRHPRLFRHWLPFGGALLTGSLPARDRELLILRTAWLCRSEYEWGQHVRLALGVGLSEEEIERVPASAARRLVPGRGRAAPRGRRAARRRLHRRRDVGRARRRATTSSSSSRS